MSKEKLHPLNGGRFISRGRGRHPERIIESDELIVVLSGELGIYEGSSSYLLKPGEWILLRRGRRHGGLTDYGKNLSFFWLHFLAGKRLLSSLPSSGVLQRPETTGNYIQSFLMEQQSAEPDREALRLLLKLIFRELARSKELTAKESRHSPLAESADNIIKMEYSSPITVADIAEKLHCNTEYLGKIYHLQFGETLTAALNRRRMEQAAKLLINTNLSVKEIVEASGIGDPAYFRRLFHRRYASTPSRFRRMHRQSHWNTE